MTSKLQSKLESKSVVIFLTVFIYLLGFGMIIPILPLLSTHYGATPLQAGLLMSAFSLMQFLFAPFWGRISDRIGRRPVLLFCLVGEGLSYLLLANARSLEMIFLARILAGFFGASISTASAYISDITPEERRSQGMALIGAAFGLGFLLGPAIGGGLTLLAEKISNEVHFVAGFSAYGVAVLCLLTFIFAYFKLDESLSDENRELARKRSETKSNRFRVLIEYFQRPVVGLLIVIFAFATFAMAMMEATLVLFMEKEFQWGIREVSFGFAYVGVCIVITQGFLVRRLLPILGEKKVLFLGLTCMFSGFFLLTIGKTLPVLAISQTLIALGTGFTNPSLLGSISLLVSGSEQGTALGTTQSLSSLARVIGPALGGFLFGLSQIGGFSILDFNTRLPFAVSCVLMLISILMVAIKRNQIPTKATKAT